MPLLFRCFFCLWSNRTTLAPYTIHQVHAPWAEPNPLHQTKSCPSRFVALLYVVKPNNPCTLHYSPSTCPMGRVESPLSNKIVSLPFCCFVLFLVKPTLGAGSLQLYSPKYMPYGQSRIPFIKHNSVPPVSSLCCGQTDPYARSLHYSPKYMPYGQSRIPFIKHNSVPPVALLFIVKPNNPRLLRSTLYISPSRFVALCLCTPIALYPMLHYI